MLSKIITKKKDYKIYLNKFLQPISFKSLDDTKIDFIKSIKAREKINRSYLGRYINFFDSNFKLSGKTSIDKDSQIDIAFPGLELYEILEVLAFSSTRKLGTSFFNLKSKIDISKLSEKLYNIYFNNKNKWTLGTTNPISLLSILENDKGYLLLLANRGKEINYVNENQKFISERTSSFFNIYISKGEHYFVSIGGVDSNEQMKYITSYLKEKLDINLGKKLIFLDVHFDIFESIATSVSRKGEIEVTGKNEIQNKSSRNTKGSDLKLKQFDGAINSIGGDFIIDGVSNLNIGFGNKKQNLSISKNNILPSEYIDILEGFIYKIYFGKIKEKRLEELFKFKLSRSELISIEENDFFDDKEIKKVELEKTYGLKFISYGRFHCKCGSFNNIDKSKIHDEIKCSNCSEKYSDYTKVDLNSFFLNMDNDFYNNLFGTKFIDDFNDKKEPIKRAEYKKQFNGDEYKFIIIYSNESDKKGIIKNTDKKLIYIFISPLVFTDDSDDIFKIHCYSNNSIFVYFNLEIFYILKDTNKRNNLFKNIVNFLLKKEGEEITSYTNCIFNNNKGDTYNGDVKNSQIKTDNSELKNLN